MHSPGGDCSVRRSPRLSSTPVNMHSPTGNCLIKKSPRSSSTPLEIDGSIIISGALALSLNVIGNGNGFQGEEPVPLKICKPNLLSGEKSKSESTSTRRSTRFTTNKYKSASPENRKVKSLPVSGLGKSPRFSPAVADSFGEKYDGALDCIAIEWPVSRGKRRRCEDNSESMEEGVWKNSKKMMCLKKCNGRVSDKFEEKCLRRSPRLNSASGSTDNGNVKCEFLTLPEPPSMEKLKIDKKTSHKTSKTRKIESQVLQKGEVEVISDIRSKSQRLIQDSGRRDYGNVMCELFASPEPPSKVKQNDDLGMSVQTLRFYNKIEFQVLKEGNEVETASIETPLENGINLGICDLAQSSEKCLRSRKIAITAVKDENKSRRNATPSKGCNLLEKKQAEQKEAPCFIGDPIPDDVAQERWRWRYDLKSRKSKRQSWILNIGEEDEVYFNVECHYLQAKIDGCIFNIGDCAFIKGEERENHIGKILEFFKTTDGEKYFRVQWFFRAEDTVMQDAAASHDKKRLFYSTLMNDNTLDCIVSKVNVIEASHALDLQLYSIQPSDFYYDMEYSVEYSTFRTLPTAQANLADGGSDISNTITPLEFPSSKPYKEELALLDLYSGCGGMSTGLCLGAKLSGVQLVTRWAIDYHKSACDSLKLNHPETQVRHTTAEDFLDLLKEWEKLCKLYVSYDSEGMLVPRSDGKEKSESNTTCVTDKKKSKAEYEVSSLVDICYGDPSESGKHGLKFKVRWEGYGPSDDTWELIEDLSNCQGHIQDFVRSGFESKILPLPGDVDVICGGPPCQGISGYNRYRNVDSPLTDERNQQIVVFMDMVKFLKPKYVLMENVTDILRFDKASLGRYALSRLVHMSYQARLGIMAAGCYGLPQFRLRVFLWGALPGEKLPQFPLPTHDVVVRYWPPSEFERNTVAYDEGQPRGLEDALVLRDAISDLPAVTSHETREQMAYERPPETDFQKYIRLTKEEMIGSASDGDIDQKSTLLYDHRPYQLSEDDYIRVCQIPHRKGANFRDLPGIIVNADSMVQRDPTKEPVILPSGKPLVPDYVFTFEKGKSKRPFARLWWDETVPTVVTFPSCHNQAALHPEQDRVLTLREYARLQGFPDYYKFCGSVKERYCQVGNAVAVPVARALGYALGMASRKLSGDEPLMTLPPNFTYQPARDGEILSNL